MFVKETILKNSVKKIVLDYTPEKRLELNRRKIVMLVN